MYRSRTYVAGILAVALFAAVAWGQETDVRKELEDAVLVLKNTAKAQPTLGFRLALEKAVRTLVEHRDEAFELVLPLLEENEVQIRLNGAIVLARFAEAGAPSDELVAALKRCLKDDCAAVAYWGLTGLASDNVSPNEKVTAIAQCLTLNHPRPLRLAAAGLAVNKEVVGIIPAMVAYLKGILPAYKAQVKAKLTYRRATTGRDRDEGRFGAGLVSPGLDRSMHKWAPQTGAAGAPAGGYKQPTRGTYALPARSTRSAVGRYPVPTDRRGPAERGRAMPGPAERGRAMPGPAARSPAYQRPMEDFRPGAGREEWDPGTRRGGEMEVEEAVIDPDELDIYQIEQLIPEIQALPAVEELHQVGLLLEELVAKSSYDSPYDFKKTPPWHLDQCAEKAIAAFEESLPKAPEKPKPTETEEAE